MLHSHSEHLPEKQELSEEHQMSESELMQQRKHEQQEMSEDIRVSEDAYERTPLITSFDTHSSHVISSVNHSGQICINVNNSANFNSSNRINKEGRRRRATIAIMNNVVNTNSNNNDDEIRKIKVDRMGLYRNEENIIKNNNNDAILNDKVRWKQLSDSNNVNTKGNITSSNTAHHIVDVYNVNNNNNNDNSNASMSTSTNQAGTSSDNNHSSTALRWESTNLLSRRQVYFNLWLFIWLKLIGSYDSGAFSAALGAAHGIAEEWELNSVEQGTLTSSVFLGNVVGCLLAGHLFSHYNEKHVLAPSLLIHTLSTFLFAAFPSYYIALGIRFVIGLTLAFVVVYTPVWVDAFAPARRQSVWMASHNAGVPVGVMIGYLIGAFFTSYTSVGWKCAFYVKCATMIPTLIYVYKISAQFLNASMLTESTKNSKSDNGSSNNNDESCLLHNGHVQLIEANELNAHETFKCEKDALHAPNNIVCEQHTLSSTHLTSLENPKDMNMAATSHTLEEHHPNQNKSLEEQERIVIALQPVENTVKVLSPSCATHVTPPNEKIALHHSLPCVLDTKENNHVKSVFTSNKSTADVIPCNNTNDNINGNESEILSWVQPSESLSSASHRSCFSSLCGHALHFIRMKCFNVRRIWNQCYYLYTNFVYMCCVLAMTSLYFVATGLQNFVTQYLREPPFNASMRSLMFGFGTAMVIAPVSGVIIGGIVLDYCGGYRRNLWRVSLISLFWGSMASLLSIGCIFTTSTFTFLLIMSGVLFCGGAVIPPGAGLTMSVLSSSLKPAGAAFSQTMYNLFGNFSGPLVCGIVAEYSGQLRYGIMTLLLSSCLGLLPVLCLCGFALRERWSGSNNNNININTGQIDHRTRSEITFSATATNNSANNIRNRNNFVNSVNTSILSLDEHNTSMVNSTNNSFRNNEINIKCLDVKECKNMPNENMICLHSNCEHEENKEWHARADEEFHVERTRVPELRTSFVRNVSHATLEPTHITRPTTNLSLTSPNHGLTNCASISRHSMSTPLFVKKPLHQTTESNINRYDDKDNKITITASNDGGEDNNYSKHEHQLLQQEHPPLPLLPSSFTAANTQHVSLPNAEHEQHQCTTELDSVHRLPCTNSDGFASTMKRNKLYCYDAPSSSVEARRRLSLPLSENSDLTLYSCCENSIPSLPSSMMATRRSTSSPTAVCKNLSDQNISSHNIH